MVKIEKIVMLELLLSDLFSKVNDLVERVDLMDKTLERDRKDLWTYVSALGNSIDYQGKGNKRLKSS